MKKQYILMMLSVGFLLPFIASATPSTNQEQAKSVWSARVATHFQQQHNTPYTDETVKKQLAGFGTSPSKR